MANDILITIGCLLTFWYDLECNPNIFHLSFYGISPESISILLVNGNNLPDDLGHLEPKFICPLKVLSNAPFHHGYNSASFLQDMVIPPIDGLFILYSATWIRCNSLTFNNFSHNAQPSIHLQKMSQQTVDFLRVSLLSITTTNFLP